MIDTNAQHAELTVISIYYWPSVKLFTQWFLPTSLWFHFSQLFVKFHDFIFEVCNYSFKRIELFELILLRLRLERGCVVTAGNLDILQRWGLLEYKISEDSHCGYEYFVFGDRELFDLTFATFGAKKLKFFFWVRNYHCSFNLYTLDISPSNFQSSIVFLHTRGCSLDNTPCSRCFWEKTYKTHRSPSSGRPMRCLSCMHLFQLEKPIVFPSSEPMAFYVSSNVNSPPFKSARCFSTS